MKCTVPHLSHRMPKWIAMVGNYGIKGKRNARLIGRRVTGATKRDFQNASRSSQPGRTPFPRSVFALCAGATRYRFASFVLSLGVGGLPICVAGLPRLCFWAAVDNSRVIGSCDATLRGWWCRVGVHLSVVVACLQEEASASVKLSKVSVSGAIQLSEVPDGVF